MITLSFGSKSYQIPTRWNEIEHCGQKVFTSLCLAMRDFESGRIDFESFKIRTALALVGVNPSEVKNMTEAFPENIYRLGEMTSSLYSTRLSDDGRKCIYIECVLRRQMLPYGYEFEISPSGMTECSITAEQYIDATQLMELYGRTFDNGVLKKLYSILYSDAKGATSEGTLVAAYYNFRGILEWIKKLDAYRLIFDRITDGSQSQPVSPLGLSGSIFQLVKGGYGDIEAIRNLDLFSYLGILVQMTVDSISACKAANMKPLETSERLKIPLELILPYYN